MAYPLNIQFSSVAQSCPTLCDPMNCSMPGLPIHHQLPEFTQTHVHQVSDAIQPSHPLSSPSPPAPSPSQHQSLFQWVNSLHKVAKVLEFQLYLKGHLAMSGGFMDCHNLGGEGRPLASGGQRSGMLPNILQGTRQLPRQRMIQPHNHGEDKKPCFNGI